MPWQKGQMVRLLVIHLPGGVEYKTNIRTFTVSAGPPEGLGRGREAVGIPSGDAAGPPPSWPCSHAQVAAEVLEELCGQMGILDPGEVQEFALFLIKRAGKPRGQAGFRVLGPPLSPRGRRFPHWGRKAAGRAGLGRQGRLRTPAPCAGELVRPLLPHEYLNSVLVDQDVSVHSRRISWESQLHFDNPTYISTHYSQVSPTWPWVAAPLSCALYPPPARPNLGGGPPSLAPPEKGWWWELVGALGHSCPLTARPSQVQRDYLQGKLVVSAQEDAQVARLAALQHLSRAPNGPPSE